MVLFKYMHISFTRHPANVTQLTYCNEISCVKTEDAIVWLKILLRPGGSALLAKVR